MPEEHSKQAHQISKTTQLDMIVQQNADPHLHIKSYNNPHGPSTEITADAEPTSSIINLALNPIHLHTIADKTRHHRSENIRRSLAQNRLDIKTKRDP